MDHLVTLTLKLPRDTQVSPEATQIFLNALFGFNRRHLLHHLQRKPKKPFALEIVRSDEQIYFQITAHPELIGFIQGQLQAAYPLITIEQCEPLFVDDTFALTTLVLKSGNYYPLKTYQEFREADPLASILSVLANAPARDQALIQYALSNASTSWQTKGEKYAHEGTRRADGGFSPRDDQKVIHEKIDHPGYAVSLRIAASNSALVSELAQAYNVFMRADGNRLVSCKPLPFRRTKLREALNARKVTNHQILTTAELATLWHLPSEKTKVASIVWGSTVLSEPPSNLPIREFSDDQAQISFFAKTLFRNREAVFGIKDADRRRHIWAIGKTGAGKSSLVATMALDDLKKGRGLAVIDPHGDLCEMLLDYVPKRRINEVIYFNPSDQEYPITINPLEVKHREQRELVVSGIISIFKKIFGYSWGPRLEYILRNALLTLTEIPDTTLKMIPPLLTNSEFRDRIIAKLQDDTLKAYWVSEYNAMPPNLQQEAISPILNKVGQFVTSPLVRNVVGRSRSSIDLEAVMNEGKILFANLSQGKIGEDNSQILGAMLITKFQLAAMQRAQTPEEKRRDFSLYVDEFQNFATDSFAKILSEARKYHLNLLLANQYVAQIPLEVQKAILGNVGTLIAFNVGAEDAYLLKRELAEVYSESDLVSLANRQIVVKMTIDGYAQRPFLAETLPLQMAPTGSKAKVIRVSRERWGRRRQKPVGKQISQTQRRRAKLKSKGSKAAA